jgi:hypothetical protein
MLGVGNGEPEAVSTSWCCGSERLAARSRMFVSTKQDATAI